MLLFWRSYFLKIKFFCFVFCINHRSVCLSGHDLCFFLNKTGLYLMYRSFVCTCTIFQIILKKKACQGFFFFKLAPGVTKIIIFQMQHIKRTEQKKTEMWKLLLNECQINALLPFSILCSLVLS